MNKKMLKILIKLEKWKTAREMQIWKNQHDLQRNQPITYLEMDFLNIYDRMGELLKEIERVTND